MKDSVAAREGWIDASRVAHELQTHRTGARDSHTRLWLILWLEVWFRVVYRGELTPDSDLSGVLHS